MIFSRITLAIQFYARKLGRFNLLLFLLLLLVLLAISMFDRINLHQQQAMMASLKRLDKEIATASAPQTQIKPSTGQYLQQFQALLGDRKYAEQELKKILDIAQKSEVQIRAGDYKQVDNVQGQFSTYSLKFPVRGSYTQIRHFVERCLLQMPNASLDELTFKRDAVSQVVLEAKVQFTVYFQLTASPVAREKFE